MQVAYDSMEVIKAMAEIGNPNSISDAGVAALAARSAVIGAHLNVQINAKDIEDKAWLENVLTKAKQIQDQTVSKETEILSAVKARL